MKRMISLILAVICLATCSVSANFNLSVDEVKVDLANQPFLVNDTVMLPLREVMEKFFYDVHWNGQNNSVDMIRENTVARVQVNSDILIINNETYIMPQKTVCLSGTTYFPLYALQKLITAETEWNYDDQVLSIALNERYKNAFSFGDDSAGEVVQLVSLIPNSEFEDGVSPWTARYTDTTLIFEKDTVRTGEGAMAFSGMAGKASGINTSVKDILAEQGEGQYVLSFWAKTNTGAVTMSVYPAKINDQNNVPFRDVTVGSEWKQYEVKVNLTWGDLISAPMIFFIDTGKHSGETIYIDDLLFVKE